MKTIRYISLFIICLILGVSIAYRVGENSTDTKQVEFIPDSSLLDSVAVVQSAFAEYRDSVEHLKRPVMRIRTPYWRTDTFEIHDTLYVYKDDYDSLYTLYEDFYYAFHTCDSLSTFFDSLLYITATRYVESVDRQNAIANLGRKEVRRGLLSRVFTAKKKRERRFENHLNKLK